MLRLSQNYLIDADDTSVTLVRETVVGASERGQHKAKEENIGKTRQVPAGFYASVQQACEAFIRKATADEVAQETATAESVIAACKSATAAVLAAVPKGRSV